MIYIYKLVKMLSSYYQVKGDANVKTQIKTVDGEKIVHGLATANGDSYCCLFCCKANGVNCWHAHCDVLLGQVGGRSGTEAVQKWC